MRHAAANVVNRDDLEHEIAAHAENAHHVLLCAHEAALHCRSDRLRQHRLAIRSPHRRPQQRDQPCTHTSKLFLSADNPSILAPLHPSLHGHKNVPNRASLDENMASNNGRHFDSHPLFHKQQHVESFLSRGHFANIRVRTVARYETAHWPPPGMHKHQFEGDRLRTSHDLELARQEAALQLPGQAFGLEVGHHQRQNRHRRPILGNQRCRPPRASVADDQARLPHNPMSHAQSLCSPELHSRLKHLQAISER